MKRWRAVLWCVGSITLVAAAFLPWPPGGRPAGLLALGLTWGVATLAAEILTAMRGRPTSTRAGFIPTDRRPADGVVGTALVTGVLGEPNPLTPGFRRFQRLEPLPLGPSPRPLPRSMTDFPPLLGRVAIFSVFVGRYGVEWSDQEIAQAHRALARAGQWVEREAIRWRASVNLDLADTYFVARDDRPASPAPVPLDDSFARYHSTEQDRYWERERFDPLIRFSSIAQQLGAADAAELIARVSRLVDADHHVWLLHHRCAGTSFAIPGDLTELPGVTLAVCHAREEELEGPLTKPPFPDPITFVHEMLHLFGAIDRYDRPLTDFPPRSVTERDVMLLELRSLSRLRVDPMTAVEIGWAPVASLSGGASSGTGNGLGVDRRRTRTEGETRREAVDEH